MIYVNLSGSQQDAHVNNILIYKISFGFFISEGYCLLFIVYLLNTHILINQPQTSMLMPNYVTTLTKPLFSGYIYAPYNTACVN